MISKDTLASQLSDGKLNLKLRHVDLEAEVASEFYLEVTDETLSEELKIVFGDTAGLYKYCFEKKQNYKIEGNGRITICYKIKLESDELAKEAFLHMQPVDLSKEEILRQLIRKWQEEVRERGRNFELLK